MLFYHKITCIFMIYVYLSRTFFVAIYALFPPIFWAEKQTPPIFFFTNVWFLRSQTIPLWNIPNDCILLHRQMGSSRNVHCQKQKWVLIQFQIATSLRPGKMLGLDCQIKMGQPVCQILLKHCNRPSIHSKSGINLTERDYVL